VNAPSGGSSDGRPGAESPINRQELSKVVPNVGGEIEGGEFNGTEKSTCETTPLGFWAKFSEAG
jgi:hypothetical protein